MRPTKFTPELLDAFRAVLTDEWAALAFTEEELVWQANRRLPQADRISYRTYQRYKADILYLEEHDDDNTVRATDTNDEANAQLVLDMHDTLKEALFAQKKALVRGVCEGQTNWRRFAWLLERKFPDFRLKPLNEVLGTKQQREPKEKQKGEDAEETEKSRAAFVAKIEAEKAEREARLKDPAYKWGLGYHPWTPMPENSCYSIYPDKLKALEEELAHDVAAGYQDPYAHLQYRADPEEHTDGVYLIMGMGPERLPLRVHVMRVADAPAAKEREVLWQKQQLERQNIIRAEQGLPPLPSPEPANGTNPVGNMRHGRGIIYGTSGA